MFDFSTDSLCVFPFFFASNIDLIDRRDSIKAQSTVCMQPSVDLTSIMGLTVWSDFHPGPGQGWPHGNKSHWSRMASDRATLCCKPSSALLLTPLMDPGWRAHSPRQQSTEPVNASLFSLLLVHAGLQGQSHCSNQTLQRQSLNLCRAG